ncbi:MAG: hypothetical protein MJD61_13390 [Proteobacteria bacterium]|nr:hypothetical protein [Pseudomonadota bacterium]
MRTLLVGRVYRGLPDAHAFAGVRFGELILRDPLPRRQTLVRWRAGLPAQLALALRAPQSALESAQGPLRLTPGLLEAMRWTETASDALQAVAIILRTSARLTPGARGRERFRRYAEQLPNREQRNYVWVPGGLWEPDVAYWLAASLGLSCAFDPMEWPEPPQRGAFARLPALGARAGLGEEVLSKFLQAVAKLQSSDTLYTVVEGVDSNRPIARLQQLADSGLWTPDSPSSALQVRADGGTSDHPPAIGPGRGDGS